MLGACDSGTEPDSVGSPSLLIGPKWLPAAHTVSPGVDYNDDGVIVTNTFAIEGACDHDDTTRFLSATKWSGDEGASKCDPSSPQIETGTYFFNAAGDSVTMTSDVDGVPTTGKVLALTATKFSVSVRSDNYPDNKSRIETFTWVAK